MSAKKRGLDPYHDSEPSTWLGRRLHATRLFLTRGMWAIELHGLPTFRMLLYKSARVVFLAATGFLRDRCLFRSSGLTYYTVLSLVPLLAFSFSVAKGLGAYEKLRQETIEPFLDQTMGESPGAYVVEEAPSDAPGAVTPAGSQELRRAIDRILEFVEGTNLSSLGAVGLLILVYTVLKLLSTIEQSFNEIWGVIRSRTLARKFSDYLSIIVLVPLFLGAAASASAAAQSNSMVAFLSESMGLGSLIDFYLKISSLVAMWIGFTLVYLFMPNTRTPLLSCLIGGIVGGTLWHVAQILHVRLQMGMANYNALYSSFAAFPIFMIWIYISWVTVLLGAEVAFAHHNEPAYRQIALARDHDQSFKEVLSLRILARVAAAFLRGSEPPSVWQLAKTLEVSEHTLREVVQALRAQRIVATTESEGDARLFPARDLDSIRVKDIFDALKGSDRRPEFPAGGAVDRALDVLYASWEEDARASSHNLTLRELGSAVIAASADDQARGPRPLGVTGASERA